MASDPIIYAIIAVPVGFYFLLQGFRKWSHYNTIISIPTSKVEALAAGFVEIYGKAVAKGDYLKSPFCGDDCVFYKYFVEEYRSHGKSSSWDIIRQGQSEPPFFIQDDTGKIEINPIKAEFDVIEKSQFEVYPGDETPETIKEFLASINMGLNTPWERLGPFEIGANKRRYIEYKIDKDMNVFVTGTAVPKEGVVSEKHEDTLQIQKGDLNKFFYISDRKEKAILDDMKKEALLYLSGGCIIELIALAYIFFRMNIL